ncbi:MAG: MurT ligase domain-containing protein [Oscillospiraceae bacterium]|nr:MurT ligase domain-containing protein [Oscillospiraceae bacterium]
MMAKKPFRFYFALVCGKLTIELLKLLRKRATNFPGSVVLTLCPDFLKYLEKPEKIIAVTGTNGKTTVSNMLLDILTDNGYDCTNNNFGGNVDTGITAALLKDSTLSGKPRKKYCTLEIDERSAVRIYPYIHPDYLICTNLTRDSYKRNAHVEYIFDILNNNIPDKTHLILNADDLISSSLKKDNKRTYFGMEPFEDEQLIDNNIIRDITVCPVCDSPLSYDFLRYNHIGRARCTKCSFCSPVPDFNTTERTFTPDGRADIKVSVNGNTEEYNVPCENTINLYNASAAITALRTFGLSYEQVSASFRKISVVKSRFDTFEKNGRTLKCILAKGQNPVACSHALNTARSTPDTAVIMIWDDFFDGKTTSENTAWIYDVDFEFLNNDNIKQIIIAGKRSPDHLLRLLIAGIPREKIKFTEHEEDAAELLDLNGIKTTYIFFDLYTDHYKEIIKEKVKEKMNNAD